MPWPRLLPRPPPCLPRRPFRWKPSPVPLLPRPPTTRRTDRPPWPAVGTVKPTATTVAPGGAGARTEPCPRSALGAGTDPERDAEAPQGRGQQEPPVGVGVGQHDQQPEDREADHAGGGDPPCRPGARPVTRRVERGEREQPEGGRHRGEGRPQGDRGPVGLPAEAEGEAELQQG